MNPFKKIELSLSALREMLGVTQNQMSERMGTGQGNISKLESRSDMRLSTLINYVQALGGSVELIASFSDETFSVAIGEKLLTESKD